MAQGDVSVSDLGAADANLNLNGNKINSIQDLQLVGSNTPSIETGGGGSDNIHIYDVANSNTIAKFSEGGSVSIPNGGLSVTGGSIQVDNGGLSMNSNSITGLHEIYPNSTGYLNTDGGAWVIRNSSFNTLMKWNDTGPIEIKNANLNVSGDITSSGMINSDGNAATKVEVLSSDPSSPETGQVWINTSQ